MTAKEELHRIIDLLPDSEIPVARRFLEYLRDVAPDDPITRKLVWAEEDPESLTPEEEAAVDRALAEARAGQAFPWEEVRRQIPD